MEYICNPILACAPSLDFFFQNVVVFVGGVDGLFVRLFVRSFIFYWLCGGPRSGCQTDEHPKFKLCKGYQNSERSLSHSQVSIG